MSERFYQLRNSLRKSLIDLKVDIYFTQQELDLLNEIISALQPVKVALENIFCEDNNLFSADVTVKFMLDELSGQYSPLSKELKEELIKRIKERRTCYSDVLQFLHDPEIITMMMTIKFSISHQKQLSQN